MNDSSWYTWTIWDLICIRRSLEFLSRAEKTIHHDPRLRHKSPPSNNMSSPLHPLQKYLTGCVTSLFTFTYFLYVRKFMASKISQYLAWYPDQISAFEIGTDFDFRFLLVSKLYFYIMWNVKGSCCASHRCWLPIEFFQICIFLMCIFQVHFPKVYFWKCII